MLSKEKLLEKLSWLEQQKVIATSELKRLQAEAVQANNSLQAIGGALQFVDMLIKEFEEKPVADHNVPLD